MCGAFTRAITPSMRHWAARPGSARSVCTAGPGEAKPEASMSRWSKGTISIASRRRASRACSVVTRSPRTVQQRQPLLSWTTFSSTPTTRRPSMPTSPNSFTITAIRWSCCVERMRLTRVVFPLPKNPATRVTGTRSAVFCLIMAFHTPRLSEADTFVVALPPSGPTPSGVVCIPYHRARAPVGLLLWDCRL